MRRKHRIAIACLFGLLVFVPLYVHATMNALGDTYQPGIDAFKQPFYRAGVAAVFIAFGSLLALAIPAFRHRHYAAIGAMGSGAVVASITVLLLSEAPCLDPHPTTEAHETHHNLSAVVSRSLLCPRYSNRSYFPPILYLGMGVFLKLVALDAWALRPRAAAQQVASADRSSTRRNRS